MTQLQLLLGLAVLLGGGGIAYGLRHLVIQLAALAILGLNPKLVGHFIERAPRALVCIVLLSLALPLIQIAPLPAAVWQALPGRELVSEAYEIAGIERDSWFTWSVDPIRTLAAFCSTIAPATIIVLGWSLTPALRLRLAQTLIALALLAVLLGAMQLSMGNSSGILQAMNPDPDVLYATFSNRNSSGIFFVIATIVLIALPNGRRPGWSFVRTAVGSLMVIAVILTQSRSSMALLLVLLAFLILRVVAQFRGGKRFARPEDVAEQGPHKAGYFAVVLGLIMIGAIAASVTFGGRASVSLDRFANLDTDRIEMWEDGLYVATRYWPVGTGMGTFDEVFQIDESLEYVSPARAGRAHNDYIEIVIETGLVGPLLLLAWFAWIALAARRRKDEKDRWLSYGAVAALICIALQSVIDYPLRNEAMLCVAAVLIVMLLPAREASR